MTTEQKIANAFIAGWRARAALDPNAPIESLEDETIDAAFALFRNIHADPEAWSD